MSVSRNICLLAFPTEYALSDILLSLLTDSICYRHICHLAETYLSLQTDYVVVDVEELRLLRSRRKYLLLLREYLLAEILSLLTACFSADIHICNS